MKSDNPGRPYFQTQLPIDFLDAALVINVWETVSVDLSENAPAKLWFIQVEQTNNGAAVEDLELEITINGTAYTWPLAGIASGAIQFCFIGVTLSAGDFTPGFSANVRTVGNALDPDTAVPFVAGDVGLIRVRQTTAVDVVSAQIEVNLVWEKLLVG